MDVNNESAQEILFIHQQMFKVGLNGEILTKCMVAMLMSLFFIYVNATMVFALRSKSVFKETARYILFAHMLFNDCIQLIFTSLLYIFSMFYLQLSKAVCSLVIVVSVTTFRNAPLNLAVMSLERYVAICFPLRHSEIATQKRTGIAIGVIWFFGSIDIVIDILIALAMDPNFINTRMFCIRERLFIALWQVHVSQGFNAFYFVSVTVIIIFTYISIMVTARSVSSDKESAKKAHKTVLLHLVQLGLCLSSFLFGIIERTLAMMTNSTNIFRNLRYLNYITVLILPRCLSPLIYGLRDDAVRPLFRYYFCYSTRKVKPAVNLH